MEQNNYLNLKQKKVHILFLLLYCYVMKQGHFFGSDDLIVLVSISSFSSLKAADPDLTLHASALNLTLTLVSVATCYSAALSSSRGLIVSLLQDCRALQKSQGQTDSADSV